MLMSHHRFSLTLAALSLSTLVACGRSDPNGSLDATEADAVARAACFDTEDELRAVLDAAYIPLDTVFLDVAAVQAACIDSEAELTPLLDDNYLAADTVLLDIADVTAVCFDSEADLTAILDDNYLAANFVPNIDFADLTGVPADLADGDDDTIYTGTSPVAVTGTDISLDPTGCVNGDALSFQGGSFGCAPPSVQPVGTEGVGAAAVNTRPFEAVPILAKVEVASGALAAAASIATIQLYNAANRAPHAFLIVDAWAVGTALTGAPVWHLRDLTTQITDDVPAPAAGAIGRVASFANQGARNILVTDSLDVRVTATAAADNATFTVYVLALPL